MCNIIIPYTRDNYVNSSLDKDYNKRSVKILNST